MNHHDPNGAPPEIYLCNERLAGEGSGLSTQSGYDDLMTGMIDEAEKAIQLAQPSGGGSKTLVALLSCPLLVDVLVDWYMAMPSSSHASPDQLFAKDTVIPGVITIVHKTHERPHSQSDCLEGRDLIRKPFHNLTVSVIVPRRDSVSTRHRLGGAHSTSGGVHALWNRTRDLAAVNRAPD